MSDSPRYGVIVSRFPKFTETFILQELRALEARGLDFELYAITHESSEQLQPDAVELDARANYLSLLSLEVATAQLHWLATAPLRYLKAWVGAIGMGRRSAETLVRTPAAVLLAATMARRMQQQGVERVHAHWATYPTLAAWVIKELTGIPYSFTAHAHDIFVEFGGLRPKIDGADLALTCTDHGRGIIVDRGGPASSDKVVLVHHGVQLDRFDRQPLRATLGAEGDRSLRVLCVGSLEEYKGHRHLVDACRLLVDDGIDVHLELLGEGPLRADLEAQIARLGLGERVAVRGRQPSAVVRESLRNCDVFALASVQLASGFMDGIPNVLVEALAVGRPVVASSLPGIRELIIDGETGLLARSGDARSLADALARLVDEPGLAVRLTDAGRAKVEAEHDAQVCLDEVFSRLASLPKFVA